MSEDGAKYSDTEESESDEEPAPQATKILRQLRGASKVEEVDRSNEVERKTTVLPAKHNFYKETKVTSLAQEEQSALPAGVLNTYEDMRRLLSVSRRRSTKRCRRCARRSIG